MALLKRTLLVVCPEGPALRLFTCAARLRGWTPGRAEIVRLPGGESDSPPTPESVASAVRPLVLRWGVSPDTEVALVLPGRVGGMLALPARAEARRGRALAAWVESELAARIPFPLKDIEYESQPCLLGGKRMIQIAWLPRSVALAYRAAFARIGLALGEIVFRAQLYAAHAPKRPARKPELVVEPFDGWCGFHLIAGSAVLRTATVQTGSAQAIADRLRLELVPAADASQPDSMPRPEVVLAETKTEFDAATGAAARDAARGFEASRRDRDLPGLFADFWRDGGSGIWPASDAPLVAVRRLAFAIAGCGAIVIAALAWNASVLRDETAALQANLAALQPRYSALRAKERQAASAATTLEAVGRVSAAAPRPQDALLAVFRALPRSAWVTRFTVEGNTATVTGLGVDSDAVVAGLERQPNVQRAEALAGGPAGAAGRAFRVAFAWSAPAARHKLTDGSRR